MRLDFGIVFEMLTLEDEISRHDELREHGILEITDAEYADLKKKLDKIYEDNPELAPTLDDGWP